jgi:hypothetical protein
VDEVVNEMRDEAGGSQARPVRTFSDSTSASLGPDGMVDIDLAKLQGAGSVVEGMSSQLASLGAEQQGDRLQRLERSLLRLERVNIEILGMLQKLVTSLKRG